MRRVSEEELLDRLDADVGWRRRELSYLATTLQRTQSNAQETAARTAVALAYAHWEGYVVHASRLVLSYVAGLRLKYRDLTDCYLAMCLSGRLMAADESRRRIQRHIDLVELFRRSDDQAVFPAPGKAIQAEGNLKSEKFDDIVTRLGIAKDPFELHYHWMDGELLRRRNQIAHGQQGYADSEFGREALITVRDLLAHYRTAARNAVVAEVYRSQ